MTESDVRERPLYLQLAQELAGAIQQGVLKAGGRLPSVRRMAHSRVLSINTVTAAYRRLEDMGLVEARPQAGYYVRARITAPAQRIVFDPALTVEAELPQPQILHMIDTVVSTQVLPDFTDLSLASPMDGYPGAKLGRILSSLLRQQPERLSRYALPPGSLLLREQIAQRGIRQGMRLHPDQIVLTHGCMEALQLALRVLTRPGDCVGLESPTYQLLLPLLANLGLKVLEIPTDAQQGISLDALEMVLAEQRIQVLCCQPNISNPLGISMPLANKQRLARLVNRYRIPLIEDALYSELQFGAEPAPTVKSFDEDGWVVLCSSFSKTLAPDFRIGWIEGGRFAQKILQLKFVSSVAESQLLADTLGHFLQAGGYDHHLRRLRQHYAVRVEVMRALVHRHFPPGTRATAPHGGFLLWVEAPENVNMLEVFNQALQHRIVLAPGCLFSPSGKFRNALRLPCCYPEALRDKYTMMVAFIGGLVTEAWRRGG